MAFTFGSTPVGSIQKKPTQTKKKTTQTTKKPTAQQKTDFRKKEQQATKTSIGTAGPKVNVTGDPSKDRSKPTAQQKIQFRKQEDQARKKSIGTAGPPKNTGPTAAQKEAFRALEDYYRTHSPGTAGDIYYKNEEGTGTGQGGSGIPKTTNKIIGSTTPKTSGSSSGVVTTTAPPVSRPPEITTVYVDPPPKDDNEEVTTLKDLVDNPPELSSYITEPNRLLYGSLSDNRLDVAQTSFFNLAEDLGKSSAPTATFSFRPTTRGSLFSNNFRLTGAEVEASFPLINKGRSLFGGT